MLGLRYASVNNRDTNNLGISALSVWQNDIIRRSTVEVSELEVSEVGRNALAGFG